jgi:2-polyprenyl-6-methoxyphenol hydroxylase-like FAD-dependent oxidoreductase
MAGIPIEVSTRCCIAGGGPAGMMLGYLLARAGIDVIVLEKWKDFFRDFRGDTIHPSTMDVLHVLGLLDGFLALEPDRARTLGGQIGGTEVTVADFSHLPAQCRFIALIPQWDFLDFLAREARRHPEFRLFMDTEVTDLIVANGRVAGVAAKGPDGPVAVRAELVVGADGRHSTTRVKSGLRLDDIGAPIDVLWFRISRRGSDPVRPLGVFDRGRILVMIARKDCWQCGFVIPKGDFDRIRAHGLAAFRDGIAALAPAVADRVYEIGSFDEVKLLSVAVNRLRRWERSGYLAIGDAAHAMSPIGGVGINLAIQDAVAAANILVPAFRRGAPDLAVLRAVELRRKFPTRATQALQLFVQNRVIRRALAQEGPVRVPWLLRLVQRFPILRRVPARLIGLGFRPEMPKLSVLDRSAAPGLLG